MKRQQHLCLAAVQQRVWLPRLRLAPRQRLPVRVQRAVDLGVGVGVGGGGSCERPAGNAASTRTTCWKAAAHRFAPVDKLPGFSVAFCAAAGAAERDCDIVGSGAAGCAAASQQPPAADAFKLAKPPPHVLRRWAHRPQQRVLASFHASRNGHCERLTHCRRMQNTQEARAAVAAAATHPDALLSLKHGNPATRALDLL
jgi:hypothetical protein